MLTGDEVREETQQQLGNTDGSGAAEDLSAQMVRAKSLIEAKTEAREMIDEAAEEPNGNQTQPPATPSLGEAVALNQIEESAIQPKP